MHPDFGIHRGGYHPLGSPEWTGGAVLGLQKNAVRFWQAGQRDKAIWFKALADALEAETRGSFYTVKGVTISQYATGQNVAVGHGWRTPLTYVKTKDGKILVQGGSPVGGWIVLAAKGLNPFIPGDPYKKVLDEIPATPLDQAREVLRKELRQEPYTEKPLTEIPKGAPSIVEARAYNDKMWKAFNRRDFREAIRWAEKSAVGEPTWVTQAKTQNALKAKAVGGLIAYPWGTTHADNANPLHNAIGKYRLLNEVGAAMAGAAMANYRLSQQPADVGDPDASRRYRDAVKSWLRRMILEDSLHQVAVTTSDKNAVGQRDLIYGYWNAIVSWLYYPEVMSDGTGLHQLITEVLQQIRDEGLLEGKNYFLPSPSGVAVVGIEDAAPDGST